jgi:hypothetical protein
VRVFVWLIVVYSATCLAVENYSLPGITSDEITMPVNVWGEVRNPGLHLIPWDSDLRDALSAAGGPTSLADLSAVRIISTGIEIKYDLNAFLSGNGASLPVMEPDATVFIGKSDYEWWKDVVDFTYKILVMANVIWLMSGR